MDDTRPRVSIGLPVYNGERYLLFALDSLLSQTFTDFELIISDNASSDRTQEMCRSYAAMDRRIRYYRNEKNLGAIWNFNRTVALASGPYFMWASHDDIWEPTFLARCMAVLEARPDTVLVHTKTRIIDENGDRVADYDATFKTDSPHASVRFHDLLRAPHKWFQTFGVIRTSVLTQTPLYGAYAASDIVLMSHLSLMGPFYEVPETLFHNRQHAQQSSKLDRYTRMAWFDSSKSTHIALPHCQVFLGLWASIWQVPLSSSERFRCCLTMLIYPLWNRNWARMGKDVFRTLLYPFRRFAL